MTQVTLRPVESGDLEILYEQQTDPEAAEMAAFPSRDRATFIEHWQRRVLVGETNYARAVISDGALAGNVVSWLDAQTGHRLLGYWLGREFWGKGIATDAVRLALEELTERPIHADVASHNVGSQRVLEKNGFVHDSPASTIGDDGVELLFYRLD